MTNNEYLGYLVAFGVPLIGSLFTVIKPIINLNSSIQKLTDSIDHLSTDTACMKKEIGEHDDRINDHETRIAIIENRNQ